MTTGVTSVYIYIFVNNNKFLTFDNNLKYCVHALDTRLKNVEIDLCLSFYIFLNTFFDIHKFNERKTFEKDVNKLFSYSLKCFIAKN